jgi:hypothetical protein
MKKYQEYILDETTCRALFKQILSLMVSTYETQIIGKTISIID